MHGSFTWNELATTDVDKARAFYQATLDWTFEEFTIPDGRYWVARVGDKLVAGLGGLEAGALRDATTSYWFSLIEVDDVDRRVAAAEEHGATVLTAPMDVPDVGRVAILRDPTGAAFGMMKGAQG